MALLSGDGWLFLLRWFHFLAGITWIGMLYYFNFVQTPFFATAEAPVRTGMLATGLVSRALWWFRWGAMFTFITGWLYLLHRMGQLGATMWFNVWFIIWPAQQVVMASATQVKGGGQAIPEAAARGQRGGFASRTNTMLSIPMLFFMGAASHLGWVGPLTRSTKMGMLILMVVVIVVAEYNALVGTAGPGKKMLSTLKGTFWAGFVLTAIFWIVSVILTPRM
jgi:uncharacterized membrane protein